MGRNGLVGWAVEFDVCESDNAGLAKGLDPLPAEGNDVEGFAKGFESGTGLVLWNGLDVGAGSSF